MSDFDQIKTLRETYERLNTILLEAINELTHESNKYAESKAKVKKIELEIKLVKEQINIEKRLMQIE